MYLLLTCLFILQMCSIAAAKLHTLIQTRPFEKLNETCYVMATIHDILRQSLLCTDVIVLTCVYFIARV